MTFARDPKIQAATAKWVSDVQIEELIVMYEKHELDWVDCWLLVAKVAERDGADAAVSVLPRKMLPEFLREYTEFSKGIYDTSQFDVEPPLDDVRIFGALASAVRKRLHQ